MDEQESLAARFEENRQHLQSVAYRMLGSLSEAEDAVQEAWLRLSRSDTSSVANFGGWLTTVVARVCLDMLRSRGSRREESFDSGHKGEPASAAGGLDPESETLLADSVGLALLVVLEKLAPPERLAFVLHDMFDVSFEEIAAIVGRTPTAARQLASRARRRVRGSNTSRTQRTDRDREVVDAFLAALRSGDFEALVAVLDPDVVVRADIPGTAEVHGALTYARQAVVFSKAARFAQAALINGSMGLVMAPRGRLLRVVQLKIAGGKIVQIDVVTDPATLQKLELSTV